MGSKQVKKSTGIATNLKDTTLNQFKIELRNKTSIEHYIVIFIALRNTLGIKIMIINKKFCEATLSRVSL